ncbi:penicillin-binding protein 2, partial [Burkholderia orbicola]|nr:penicillin-binding protein 2 [Burkholderia orbicola]
GTTGCGSAVKPAAIVAGFDVSPTTGALTGSVADAAAATAASLPPIRRPHRPRRPASDAQPVAAAPRDDNHRATAPAKAADAGTAH